MLQLSLFTNYRMEQVITSDLGVVALRLALTKGEIAQPAIVCHAVGRTGIPAQLG